MSDATTPAVVQDAQRYDWREDLDMATDYGSTMGLDAAARVAAYIEHLQAERDALLAEMESFVAWAESYPKSVWHEPNADALKAAHDALKAAGLDGIDALSAMLYRHALKNIGHRARAAIAAYDNAEKPLVCECGERKTTVIHAPTLAGSRRTEGK
jgi:hypothetical protein